MLGNSLAKLTDTPDVLCTPSGPLPWQDAPPALDLSAAQGLLILWPTDYPMVGLQDITAPHLSGSPCSFWKETREKKRGRAGEGACSSILICFKLGFLSGELEKHWRLNKLDRRSFKLKFQSLQPMVMSSVINFHFVPLAKPEADCSVRFLVKYVLYFGGSTQVVCMFSVWVS